MAKPSLLCPATAVEHGGEVVAGAEHLWTGLHLAQAVHIEPAPPLPVDVRPSPSETNFSDYFADSGLDSAWTVVNPDTDNYIVENGHLQLVATTVGGFDNDKTANIFRLNRALPGKDWVIEIEVQTWRESFMFGLIDDTKNYLAAQLYSWSTCCSGKGVILRVMKVTGGVTTKFEIPVEPIASGAMPVVIRLKKDGREFRAGLNFEGHIDKDGNPVWIETGSVTSLRPPKTFALTAAQWEQTTGESSFYISAVTIKATTE